MRSIRSSFKILQEFFGIRVIYSNCWIREISMHWIPLPSCGSNQKETPRKIEKKQLVCSSWECSSTPAGFGKEFLNKEQCDNTVAHPYSPHLAPTDFYLFLELNQHCRDGSFVKTLTSLRMRRKSWKGFHNMASRNVSNTFTEADRRF